MRSTKERACLPALLALAAFLAAAGPAAALTISLGPYLQNVTDTGVVVRFRLDAAAPVEVRYGPTDAYGSVESAPAATEFEVALGGLSPGALYHYGVFSGGTRLAGDASFTTAPPPRAPFRLLVFGDTRSDHTAHAQVIAGASGKAPHVSLNTGDLVSDGGEMDGWLTYFEVEAPLLRGVPQFPVIGNHDESDGDAENYRDFFTVPRNSPRPGDYYSFTYGNLHGVVLDGHVNVDPSYLCVLRTGAWEDCFNQEQLNWLIADLDAAAADPDVDHVFVFVHGGPYSSKAGRTGSKQMRELLPAFAARGVEIVFSGHDHYYERGFSPEGIMYVVTGGGGAPLYEPTAPCAAPHTVIGAESVHHYVIVDVNWLQVTMTVYRVDGTQLDLYGYAGTPRACADAARDCGALPPACPAGRWECVAGYCETAGCEPGDDDGPAEPGAETVEPVAEADAAGDPSPDAGEPAADGGGDASAPDLPGADLAGDAEAGGEAGCSCAVVE